MAAKGNDPKALEKFGMEQAQKQAINHFAGKEKELEAAMNQMTKYKLKYSSLNSIKAIPKRVPNDLHGKPFIERVVPGVTFQFQRRNMVTLDFNPLLGYRFNPRFTAGAGWNERIGFRHYHITQENRIFGPRTFGEFKFKKGFAVRGEVERMSTVIPSLNASGGTIDAGSRTWVWGVFGGVKKDYTISKYIKGNIQMLYNFTDKNYKTNPYADRFNVRMGFACQPKPRSQ
jgi:hypothetical protein